MRIRMKTSIAGPTVSAGPGQEIEVNDADGARLIASGQAEAVKTKKEAATRSRRETASLAD